MYIFDNKKEYHRLLWYYCCRIYTQVRASIPLGISFNQKFPNYGAFELGVSYHYALSVMPLYKYDIGINGQEYSQDFTPPISYLSFDLTYFFGKNRIKSEPKTNKG
jgi:hypothetical protein